MSKATQLTIRELKRQGRKCGIVERFNPHVGSHGIRQDLFGIIDILALDPERGVVGVQCCSGGLASHRRKMMEEKAQEAIDWLETPGTVLEIWCWRKIKAKRGGKAMVWRPIVEEIKLEDIVEEYDD